MSTDYYVVCHECKEAIQIASDGFSGFSFYRNELACMQALHTFLEKHVMHIDKMGFAPEQYYEDYKIIEWQLSRK